MKRFGGIIGLRPEFYEAYKREHTAVWSEVLAMIESCNIRRYTIYHHDGVLFAHYEYWGTDHKADMAKMAADPATQRWWLMMAPMQTKLEGTRTGSCGCPWRRFFTLRGRGIRGTYAFVAPVVRRKSASSKRAL